MRRKISDLKIFKTVTGDTLNKIAMGCWGIGGTYEIAGKQEGIPETENPLETISNAFNNGINMFDTSYSYGKSEEILGRVFEKCREKVFIASKCGIIQDGSRNFDFSNIYKSIQMSLKKLKTNYLDLYQITLSNQDIINEKMVENLIKLKQKKLTRYIGLSISNYRQGLKALEYNEIDSLQFVLNLIDTRNITLLNFCKEKSCLTIIKSPLNKGVLTDINYDFSLYDSRRNYLSKERIKLRRDTAYKILYSTSRLLDNKLDFKPYDDLKEKAILFLMSLINNGVIIFGIRSKEHVNEFIKLKNKTLFDAETINSLTSYSKKYFNEIQHTL
ncbi:aldo/keto reductase [Candidatus Magnetomorum sp. HK-1]|nr:aldo/keto reductase [Candidatus Magnetomorum sp. HK-1]